MTVYIICITHEFSSKYLKKDPKMHITLNPTMKQVHTNIKMVQYNLV